MSSLNRGFWTPGEWQLCGMQTQHPGRVPNVSYGPFATVTIMEPPYISKAVIQVRIGWALCADIAATGLKSDVGDLISSKVEN